MELLKDDQKRRDTLTMKKILSHIDEQLTVTSQDFPYFTYATMLEHVAYEMRLRHQELFS